MNPFYKRSSVAQRLPPRAASWFALYAAWLCAAVFTTAFLQQNTRLAVSARSVDAASSTSNRSVDPRGSEAAALRAEPPDFVSALQRVADPDLTFRFAARLAHDQGIQISQMQSEFIATEANKLGQAKFTLQLRGDYVRIKNVMIDLLAKFPGLTLQHLTIHHRDAAPGNSADTSSDEASLELIQYLRPAATS